jgi:hypothetical protein
VTQGDGGAAGRPAFERAVSLLEPYQQFLSDPCRPGAAYAPSVTTQATSDAGQPPSQISAGPVEVIRNPSL